MSNRLVYDYMTLVTKMHTIEEVKELFGIDHLNWMLFPGRYCYPYRQSYDSMIHIYYGASEEMGICIEFSGQGCRLFESFGNGDYISIFKLVNNHPDKIWFTRLDIAYDDFDGIDINRIVRDTIDENFVSKFHSAKLDADIMRNGKIGYSVTFGKRGGAIMIRIYDKKTEQETRKYMTIDCPDGISRWCRIEIQFNKDRVMPMLQEFACTDYSMDGLQKIYLGTLVNYLRFIEKPIAERIGGDSNKRRWDTTDYWKKLVEDVGRLSLYRADTAPYTITRAKDNVFERNIGSVKAMMEVMGAETFTQVIQDMPYPRNPKYKNMVDQYHMNEEKKEFSYQYEDDELNWED